MELLKPIQGAWIVTQTFAEHNKRRIQNGWKYYNGGVDLACPEGTTIYASMDGKIERKMQSDGYGTHIKQSDGIWMVVYGHLSDFLVQDGARVHAGDPIARSGNTGNSSGPHLHWEVRKNGVPVDPIPLLSTVVTPPVEIPPQEFILPNIPNIPMVEVIISGPLNIRTHPEASGRILGQLFLGTAVPVIGSRRDGDDIWLQIGYGQWIAGRHKGEVYVKNLTATY